MPAPAAARRISAVPFGPGADRLQTILPAHVVAPPPSRPRRRAVLRYRLRAQAAPGLLFAKVLTPGRARRLLALADALRPSRPAGPGAGEAGDAPEPMLRFALPAGRIGPGVLILPSLA